MRKPRFLFLGKTAPLHDRASGDYRLLQILEILAPRFDIDFLGTCHPVVDRELGQLMHYPRDTNLPTARYNFIEGPYIENLRRIGVNPLMDTHPRPFAIRPTMDFDIAPYLTGQKYDGIWIEFFYQADAYLSTIRTHQPWAHVFVDSVDLHYRRLSRQLEYLENKVKYTVNRKHERRRLGAKHRERIAHLSGHLEHVEKHELRTYSQADSVIVVSEDDQALLASKLPAAPLLFVPNIHRPPSSAQTLAPRAGRKGIIFVGNFDHEPNVSSAVFIKHEIAPLLGANTGPIRIVGNNPPKVVRTMGAFGPAVDQIQVLGYVQETKPHLDASMVSVAPVLFGAGMNGKIGEALAAGLPVVTSELGARGMGLTHGENCWVAETPSEYAAGISRLHEDSDFWHKLQHNGLAHVMDLASTQWTTSLPHLIENALSLERIRAAQKHRHNIPRLDPIQLPDPSFFPPKGKPTHSIILLTYNQWKFTRLCLQSLANAQRRHPKIDIEVILVDNSSADETAAEAQKIPGLRVILNGRNLGFAAGNNVGIAAARGENIILLNNDTIVSPDWLFRLSELARRIPKLGVLCPSTNTEHFQTIPNAQYDSLESFFSFNKALALENYGAWDTVEKVSGLCMYVPRSTIEKVGVLDPGYGIGYFEDDDYSLRVQDSGLRLVVAKDVYVHHFGSVSFGGFSKQRDQHMQRGLNNFIFKWGKRGLDHVARAHQETLIRLNRKQSNAW